MLLDPRRRLHRRGAGRARARRRATRSCSPTTGTRPSASSSPGSRRAAPASRPPTSATAQRPRRAARRAARGASTARRPGQPAALRARARLHRGDERDRRAPRRRGGRRARAPRSSCYASSLHVYGQRAGGRDRRPSIRTARSATSRTSRRSTRSCASACTPAAAASSSPSCGSGSSTGRARSSTTRPDSQTVVDKFRRLAAAGEQLPLDDGGRATIGVVHVEDAARHPARLAALAGLETAKRRRRDADRRRRCGAGRRARAAGRRRAARSRHRFEYGTSVADVPRAMKFLVTARPASSARASATLLRERGHDVRRARPPGRRRASDPGSTRSQSTPATRRARARSRAATPCCTSRASPTRRARARTRPAPCARTPARPSTCSTAAPSTAPGCLPVDRPRSGRAAARRRTRSPSASERMPAASTPRRATVVRLTSVFGPGQVAWEGATGAIARSPRRALEGRADRHPRRPAARARLRLRRRLVAALEQIAADGPLERDAHARQRRPDPAAARGRARASRRGRLVCRSRRPEESCPPGENESYEADGTLAR